jgi:hypothetical protein
MAVRLGYVGQARNCIDHHGADPNALGPGDVHGPLHWAVIARDIDMTRMLLGRGAAPDAVDGLGRSPMWFCAAMGDVRADSAQESLDAEIRRVLLDAGADPWIDSKQWKETAFSRAEACKSVSVRSHFASIKGKGRAALPCMIAKNAEYAEFMETGSRRRVGPRN